MFDDIFSPILKNFYQPKVSLGGWPIACPGERFYGAVCRADTCLLAHPIRLMVSLFLREVIATKGSAMAYSASEQAIAIEPIIGHLKERLWAVPHYAPT